MIATIISCSVVLFLSFAGALVSFGKLTQSVNDLRKNDEQRIAELEKLENKVDGLSERIASLEAVIGRRSTNG